MPANLSATRRTLSPVAVSMSIVARECTGIAGNGAQWIAGKSAQVAGGPLAWRPAPAATRSCRSEYGRLTAFLSALQGERPRILPALESLGQVTASGNDDRLGVVCQAIPSGGGEERISRAEEVGPFGRCTIAGHQDTAGLVALVDHVVEIGGSRISERPEAEVVEYQQVGANVNREATLPGAVGTPTVQMSQHLVGADKEDVEPLPAGLMGQGLSQMTFPHARGPADQEIALAGAGSRRWPVAAPAAD